MSSPDLPAIELRRPIDRAVRVSAVLTVSAMAALLVLGGLVTSLRAGMADKAWPTRPTYLAENPDVWRWENLGFLVEHSHRAAGFLTGGLASVLAVLVWVAEPRRGLRWLGLIAVFSLLGVYGQFHREMGEAWAARQAGEGRTWPRGTAAACGAAAAVLVAVGAASVRAGSRGGWVRLLASVGLIAVMVQGLLGGFRVFLDQLVGTELAAVHGTFAQLVFTLLLVVVVLSAARRPGDTLPGADRARLGTLSLLLPAAVFVQLVWGVLVRHAGSPLAQRLHILTAFVVTGLAVWLAVRALATPVGRRALGFHSWHLLGILAVQVLLGVEAWMGKFAAAGPEMAKPPGLRTVTVPAAGVRTAHVLVGTALLAVAVLFALRVWRRPAAAPAEEPARTNPAAEPVAAA